MEAQTYSYTRQNLAQVMAQVNDKKPRPNPLVALTGVFVLSFWNLLLFGWVTIIAGIVIAMVMAPYFTKHRREE